MSPGCPTAEFLLVRAIATHARQDMMQSAWSRAVRHARVRIGCRSRRGIFDTREYYDRVYGELGPGQILEWYTADWGGLGDALAPSLAQHGRSPRRLLDLGCGTSRVPAQLARTPGVRLVVGVDVSGAAVEVQRASAPTGRSP